MLTKETHVNLLNRFLSERGLSVPFTINLKKAGLEDINSVEDLVNHIHKYRKPIKDAIVVAFPWNVDFDEDRGTSYWKMVSKAWCVLLDERAKL